jgi:hypothetical protein
MFTVDALHVVHLGAVKRLCFLMLGPPKDSNLAVRPFSRRSLSL